MKYLINGVDGQLGNVAAEEMLTLADPQKLIFCAPSLERVKPEYLKKWADLGVELREASYDNYDQMLESYKGVERMLLISTWAIGELRRNQHRNAIKAAKAAGVKYICYTSFCGAEIAENTPIIASDHRDTELAILESGLQYNFQRNMLYYDNLFAMFFPLAVNKNNNIWASNVNGVKCAYVLREDCSRVAAALLAGKGEPNEAYLVTGPELLSEEEIFKIASNYTGIDVEYKNFTTEELYKYWMGKGVPKTINGDFSSSIFPQGICADDLVGNGDSLRSGHFVKLTNTVEKLTSRKPVSAKDAVSRYKDVLPCK